MKTLIYVFAITFLVSCTDAGTVTRYQNGTTISEKDPQFAEQIEVIRYYYADDASIYIARFKDCPNVVTTTWTEQQGKIQVQKSAVTIFENDSVQVILKNKDE